MTQELAVEFQSTDLKFYDHSQVKTNFRTAITLPEKAWARFRDVFSDYCEKMKEGGGGGVSLGSSSTGSGQGGSAIMSEGSKPQGPQVSSSAPGNSQPANASQSLDSPLIK